MEFKHVDVVYILDIGVFIRHWKNLKKREKYQSGMRNWRLISLEGNKRETGRAAVASQPLTGKDVGTVLLSQ